jgi:hypothetical protein
MIDMFFKIWSKLFGSDKKQEIIPSTIGPWILVSIDPSMVSCVTGKKLLVLTYERKEEN